MMSDKEVPDAQASGWAAKIFIHADKYVVHMRTFRACRRGGFFLANLRWEFQILHLSSRHHFLMVNGIVRDKHYLLWTLSFRMSSVHKPPRGVFLSPAPLRHLEIGLFLHNGRTKFVHTRSWHIFGWGIWNNRVEIEWCADSLVRLPCSFSRSKMTCARCGLLCSVMSFQIFIFGFSPF